MFSRISKNSNSCKQSHAMLKTSQAKACKAAGIDIDGNCEAARHAVSEVGELSSGESLVLLDVAGEPALGLFSFALSTQAFVAAAPLSAPCYLVFLKCRRLSRSRWQATSETLACRPSDLRHRLPYAKTLNQICVLLPRQRFALD